jgi:hypothetical protein
VLTRLPPKNHELGKLLEGGKRGKKEACEKFYFFHAKLPLVVH